MGAKEQDAEMSPGEQCIKKIIKETSNLARAFSKKKKTGLSKYLQKAALPADSARLKIPDIICAR